MRHRYQAEQWLPFPVETVFAFFADPANLPQLMPAWQRARIETLTLVAPVPASSAQSHAGVVAGAGTTMTISFRPVPFSPVRVPWDAEITEFAWNEHFCDVQHRGPFAYWRHCHRLSAERREGEDGSLLRDVVEYGLPGGWLGDVANALGVRRQIAGIFAYRQRRTADLLAAAAGS